MAYPSTVTTFTTKNNGDTIQAAHVNALQTEITALESALLTGGLAHTLEPATTDLYSLGSVRRWLGASIKTLTSVAVRIKESPSAVEGNNYVEITINEALAADRTLGVALGDANRTLTISGNATISQDYSITGTPRFAQIGVGAAASVGALLSVTGAFTGVGAASGVSITPTLTVPADGNGALLNITGTLVEAGSGTHALMASIRCLAPTITGGAGAVTNAATLYIDAAPTATVTGATYAFWADAGTTRLDGQVQTRGLASATLANGDNNNLAPSGLSSAARLELTPDAGGSNLSGITAQPDGTILSILNMHATVSITLLADNANSTEANRFAASTVNTVLIAGHAVQAIYSSTSSRWHLLSPTV